MNQALKEHVANLREALLELPPVGERGFEGLLAETLTGISGVPFRLAGSGSQFGLDGNAAYESDHVCFEGKLYVGQIPREKVLSKIAELSIRHEDGIDLWVLGATTQVNSQLADQVHKLGRKNGIGTFILDWSDGGMSPLAVALAMSETAAVEFLESHIEESGLAPRAAASLKAIRGGAGFADHAVRIRSKLLECTIGTGAAGRANSEWLTDVFSSKRQAKRFLGQPLSPGDTSASASKLREALVNQMNPLLTGKPNGEITIVLGEEGNGKSWLVAQTWLSVESKPLMVVFTADELNESVVSARLRGILVDKLMEQTGGRRSEQARNRWDRKLEQWRNLGAPDRPRLVVFVDGLNQRPRVDWARLMEGMGSELDRIGGRLVVTTRTAYYTDRIKRRLYSPVLEVKVPEWTDNERDAILDSHGFGGTELQAPVAASLKNPRLLGIALQLLQSAQIEELEELTVSRLLFEHIRAYERDAPSPRPASEFARKLREHARKILLRVSAQQRDDLKIFDGGLEAVSDGRFFIQLEGDSTRYRLDEDGLTLALGFAVLDELRAALRNQRDLADTLNAMIEPINALDRTAEVVFAALTVACLDANCPAEIGAAIGGAFAELQNPNPDEFPAFVSLAKKRPEVFMQAAHRLRLSSEHQPNFDWIAEALEIAKADELAWSAMSSSLESWLGYYSLSPERLMFSHPSRDPDEKVQKERAERRKKLEARLGALSAPEREMMDLLVRNDDGDLSKLARFALTLMAGKPLAPFATALARWSFANALNSDHAAPDEEFKHLIRLNRADWPAARQAILKACEVFEAPGVSRTGKWALANLLRATGEPDDAVRAQALIAELTVDRPRFDPWRLVEEYCATDPCDPTSTKPENIENTATGYATIDVSKIQVSLGTSITDQFFSGAGPAIARFESEVGVEKHREFITNVLGRNDFPLRQGILQLRRHNPLLIPENADRLVKGVGPEVAVGKRGTLSESDRWTVSQSCLLLAFPFLGGREQIESLMSQPPDNDILLGLMDVAKPLDEATFSTLLDKAVRDNNEREQFVVLLFARCTDTPVPQNARDNLGSLMGVDSERVRAQALGLIAKIGDERLIDAVVQSGWNAANIAKDDSYEIWYGSSVILEAGVRGIIPHNEALDRMAPRFYGWAALRLSENAVRDIATRIDVSIRSVFNLPTESVVLDTEISIQRGDSAEPPIYHVSEMPSSSDDPTDIIKRISETSETFEKRQERKIAAFKAFKSRLTQANARIIIDNFRIEEFDAIAALDNNLAQSWYKMFIESPKSQLPVVHNLGLLLAHALAPLSPEEAEHLFRILSDTKPFVRDTFGRAAIPLEPMAIWSAQGSPALRDLRYRRLDKAGSDNEIAIDVLAALLNEKGDLLKEYVEARLLTDEPAPIARALMVTGLSEHCTFNDEVLARYQDTPGFLGNAQEAARYAYVRNIWSEHWFKKMCETELPADFWRYSVLLTRIVDGRFDVWRSSYQEYGEPYRLFWPCVENQLQHRFKKWERNREKKLFGSNAPSTAFLPH